MNSITVITGPTASGKSALALRLAEEDPSIEIVNADASLIYKGFDIGTAKPTIEERASVQHHLIDICEPHEPFSAAAYSDLARTAIREIIARKKKPLIVGGTGLYIDALFDGLNPVNASEEAQVSARSRAEREYQEQGFDTLHAALQKIDPILFRQIQRERNPIRLLRAWEFYYATGTPLGEARRKEADPFEYSPSYHVLEVERGELWSRIELRTGQMLASGWVEEVRSLLAAGVTMEMPAMRAIGYRELAAVIQGSTTLEAAREKIIIRTRQYAKRQVTWMKKYAGKNS